MACLSPTQDKAGQGGEVRLRGPGALLTEQNLDEKTVGPPSVISSPVWVEVWLCFLQVWKGGRGVDEEMT